MRVRSVSREEVWAIGVNLVMRSTVVLAVEVLAAMQYALCDLNCPAVDGLELSLFGAEENVI